MFLYKNETIEAERLLLRRFALTDAPKVAKMCNDYNVYKNTLSLPHPYTQECAESWISTHDENFRNDRFYDFAVTDKKTGELYGCMGLGVNAKDKNGELGYWFGKEYWGNGYATEAAAAMIEFAFKIKKLHRVHARHYESNPASGRVMRKCGMVYEGTQKEHIFKIDRYENVVLYGIVNENDKSGR